MQKYLRAFCCIKKTTFYVTIARITPTYTAPTGLTATVGDTLASIDLSSFGTDDGTWSWEDGTATLSEAGEKTYNAIYTPTDTTNYKTVTVGLTVTVTEASTGADFCSEDNSGENTGTEDNTDNNIGDDEEESGIGGGEITGIVIGTVALVSVATGLIAMFVRRKKNS